MKKLIASLFGLFLAVTSASAAPLTTQPNSVGMILSPCNSNVPLVGAGSGNPVACWTGPLGSAAALAAGNVAGDVFTLPTATRTGDLIYWNGSAWINFAGNNSGTQFLTENASGAPAWAAGGGGSCPGGTSGQVQVNSSGSCAGLTNTQLTADVNVATAALSGAVPAFPNNTTTFLRGDLTYATLNFAAIGGTASNAQIPAPTAIALGGVESITCSASQWINAISTLGVPACTQPAFTNISGTIATGQVSGSYTGITGVGTLAAGSTGAGFTIALGSSTITGALGYTNGGCGGTTTQTACRNSVFPTPTQAGDVAYWNGTAWVTLAGNNSGTNFLQESSLGVPSWQPVSGSGTVTSVVCGTGLSGGTITTSGTCAVNLSFLPNSLGSDVALNNTATFFTGPTVAQGTTGTWCGMGTVTVNDTAGLAGFFVQLTDGSTVIASTSGTNIAAGDSASISVSGCKATPAGNFTITVRDVSSVSGHILASTTGLGKDSTLSVWRIQ